METVMLELIGGFGLFLAGMHLMRRSLEKVAGNKLRGLLRNLSTSKFLGLLGGLLFTAILQSSSESTTMVVEFVNSELMNLAQATGIILGANIGTTVTALLVSLPLNLIAPFFLLAGALIIHFIDQAVYRQTGEIILGFGMMFTGTGILSNSMELLQNVPEVLHFFAALTNPLFAFLLGLIVTILLQSSAVTVSILVLMASQGLLDLDICVYFILGCNLGSCSTALMTSVDGSKNAKRAAFIHLLLNVFGTMIISISIILFGNELEELVYFISGYHGDTYALGRCVAITHLLFKLFQVIVLYPFTGWIAKLTYSIIPGEDKEETNPYEYHLEYIDPVTLPNPTIAILSAVQEMERMALIAQENLNLALDCLLLKDEKKIEQVYETEKYLDFLHKSINDYLIKINQDTLPLGDAKMISAYFHVINDIERIGDHAENFVEMVSAFSGDELEFNDSSIKELKEMMDLVNQLIEKSIQIFATGKTAYVDDVKAIEEQIDIMERNLQSMHIHRVNKGECTPQAAVYLSDIVSDLERVADHAINIAFALAEARDTIIMF